MKRRAAGIVAFAALVALQAWLRPDSPRARTPPTYAESSAGVLLGALRPLFVAMTWLQAEAALDDHRLLDALDRLRLLEAADPGSFEASMFRAHLVSHNLADRERGAARAERIGEALAILDAAAGRTSDPAPLVTKGQLLLEARMGEAELSALMEKKLGKSPRAAALDALLGALARAPSSDRIRRLAMEAARLRAIELLVRDVPFDDVVAAFDQADALARDVHADVLARRLTQSWAALVRAAAKSDAAAIAEAEARFAAVLSEWSAVAPPGSDGEAVLAAALARRAVPLAELRKAGGDAAAALSLVHVVHTIRQLVAARLDRSRPSLVKDLADRRRILALLDEIARQTPDLAPRISELRELVSAW